MRNASSVLAVLLCVALTVSAQDLENVPRSITFLDGCSTEERPIDAPAAAFGSFIQNVQQLVEKPMSNGATNCGVC